MNSKIHSAFDARDLPAVNKQILDIIAQDASEYSALTEIGIGGFSPKLISTMIAAMDSAQQGVTTASIPTPIQFLQSWIPGLVKVLTAARKSDEIMGTNTIGSWEDEEVVQAVLENTGTAVPYTDLGNVPLASWNQNFVTRTIVRFELGIRVGRLEEARAAKARVNSAQEKREAASNQLEIQRNLVAFYGYNGGNNLTYGFLNDPALPAYVTVAASGTGSTTPWANKTFANIQADLRAGFVQLRTQSLDTIDPKKTKIRLVIATNCVDFLSVTTDYGESVQDWLNKAYPNVAVESAPQLNAANGGSNVFYMFAERVEDNSTDGGQTIIQVVPAKFQLLGVQPGMKGYEEDYSNATAGVMVKRPYAFYRASGI